MPGVKAVIFKSPCIAISKPTANAEFPTSAYSARNVSVRLAVLLLLSQTVR